MDSISPSSTANTPESFHPLRGKWVSLFEAQQCLRKAQGWMTNSPEDFEGIELSVVRFAMKHMRQADEMLESVIQEGRSAEWTDGN